MIKSKIILTLGTTLAVATPIAAVVSCNEKDKTININTVGDVLKFKRKNIKEILDNIKESEGTKEKAYKAIDKFNLSDELKDAFKEYIKKQDTYQTAWHLLNFIYSSTDLDDTAFALAARTSIVTDGDLKDLKIDEAPEYLKNSVHYKKIDGDDVKQLKQLILFTIIMSGESTVEGIVKNIVSKFSGENNNFNHTVKIAATIDTTKNPKELKTSTFWTMAVGAMGGNATVKYLFEKAGWTTNIK